MSEAGGSFVCWHSWTSHHLVWESFYKTWSLNQKQTSEVIHMTWCRALRKRTSQTECVIKHTYCEFNKTFHCRWEQTHLIIFPLQRCFTLFSPHTLFLSYNSREAVVTKWTKDRSWICSVDREWWTTGHCDSSWFYCDMIHSCEPADIKLCWVSYLNVSPDDIISPTWWSSDFQVREKTC